MYLFGPGSTAVRGIRVLVTIFGYQAIIYQGYADFADHCGFTPVVTDAALRE